MYDQVIAYLKIQPLFRERVHKDRGIVNLLIKRYPALENIPKEILIDMVKDYNSMDRYWRMATAEYPELRGNDYNTKKALEQKKELELGYSPSHYQDVKQKSLYA